MALQFKLHVIYFYFIMKKLPSFPYSKLYSSA